MTFTAEQQQRHRAAFIDDCQAWCAACNANWVGAQLDKLIEDYANSKAEDEKLEARVARRAD
jgi:hypothetical protein